MKTKWIQMKIKGWMGTATMAVFPGATVADFLRMAGLDAPGFLSIKQQFFPLDESAILYNYVKDFDTVSVELDLVALGTN
ncbi:hypothetical protein HYR54_09985 [Candidatus Acetothermia bacterium]|nr:hypothetical protein [Candidatus Acetothermia bacterium]MBI3460652.1 hypothetical protein [Candidatus Acetothermia bacterium]MBI3660426.1 hypothetical protein [Candidatus Acetothermia bacterium]